MKKLVSILLPVLLLSSCLTTPTISTPDLAGRWKSGDLCCGGETINVQQTGENAVATKITGGVYVPAGQITWRVNVRTGIGELQVSDIGYTNARYIPATLRIINSDSLEIIASKSLEGVLTFSRLK
jgi:Cyclin D1 binding domain